MTPDDPRAVPFRSPRARFTVLHPTPDADATRGHRQNAERVARKLVDLNPALLKAVEEFVDACWPYSYGEDDEGGGAR